ncbi:uncharacterized protein LOC132614001 [Lycium barbarum]|uniref:uncharacterized protein LOC132614001 n=1 Tax=Lycium barbarum TaxID=112863 RepID=UPI00293EF100|nr:uncharacterized protein LOC132614001 [Lycium barbarum]
MSPFLFVICMEYLTRLLKGLKKDPDFNYHPRCEKLDIVQLEFADDLLLFCRGDVGSVMKLYNCFLSFSAASGLIANTTKSSPYFGGMDHNTQQEVLEKLQFTQGGLPFRYLGVPLSTKRLSAIQYVPLIDAMMSKVTHWTAKVLTYAGRLQLLKSVLFSIQNFWAQIFILPKKVLKKIETICRTFLWTGSNEVSNKAMVSWEQLCLPKSAGGLNILHAQTWNKAASWMRRKIFKATQLLEAIGMDYTQVMGSVDFSIKQVYTKLRGSFPKVSWRKLVCNNYGAPKWTFILYLTLHKRLYTRHRLLKWRSTKMYVLCVVLRKNQLTICSSNALTLLKYGTNCSLGRSTPEEQRSRLQKLAGWKEITESFRQRKEARQFLPDSSYKRQ